MNSEDDTFRVLSRPSVEEMVLLYKEFKLAGMCGGIHYDTRTNITFANHYGWDWVEFLRAAKAKGIDIY